MQFLKNIGTHLSGLPERTGSFIQSLSEDPTKPLFVASDIALIILSAGVGAWIIRGITLLVLRMNGLV